MTDRNALIRRARLLAGASVAYNVIEAVIAIVAGLVAVSDAPAASSDAVRRPLGQSSVRIASSRGGETTLPAPLGDMMSRARDFLHRRRFPGSPPLLG